MAKIETATKPADSAIVITRVIDAPREQVFAAWTHPNHLSHWFGPRGFTLTTFAFDFRPGGVWRFIMHGPDGVDYPNKIVFLEIASPDRLMYRHPGDDGAEDMQCQTTVTFVDRDGQTELTLRMDFATAAERDRVEAKYGAVAGGEQTLARLAEHVTEVTRTGREVVITRVFDAPVDLVFRAWTDAKHVARWWGPKGFTNPVCVWDAQPGGRIHIDMTGPDGVVYPMKGTFHEIVAPERIVFSTRVFEDDEGRPRLEVRNTITFTTHDGKTTVTVRNLILTLAPEMAGAVAGMEAGWRQSLEKLAGSLTDIFIISRVFDAPRGLVFKAWTEGDRLSRWFGPKGLTTRSHKNDLRPGGIFHFSMQASDGQTMWGKWAYQEIVEPERLVFITSFSDEAGGIVRAPFNSNWPLEVLSTVLLTEHEGKTTLTMSAVPVNATEIERKTFADGHGMQHGWKCTLDQLADYLA